MSARSITTWRDGLRVVIGVAMLCLGILGLFLPILQGILFLLVAGFLLAPYSPTIQWLLDRARHRYPRTFARAHAMREKLRRRPRKVK